MSAGKDGDLLKLIPDAIVGLRRDGTVVSWSAGAHSMLGYAPTEAVGRNFSDLVVPPNRLEDHRHALDRATETGSATYATVRRRKDGALVSVAGTAVHVRRTRPETSFVLCTEKDVSVFGRSPPVGEQSFREVFLNCPMPMWIYNIAGLRFLEVNDVAVEHYGYTREEFLNMTLLDIRPPEDAERLLSVVRAQAPGFIPTAGWRHRRKNGKTIDVEVYTHDIRFNDEAARIALIIDVTARHETERQLLQAQKMEAVGQLTGGVAHDFNNILMVLMAQIDALEEEEELTPFARSRVANIGRATQRAADLTRQLLAFSRKQPLKPQATNLNDLVSTTGRLLRRTLGERIEIESILADDLWTINVDRAQLESALVNLCLNARDAMPVGGRLLIETRNVELGGDYVAQYPDVAAGPHVMLAVTDTGLGIAPEQLSHVFEPFFTTKEVGKGTGLGLSMVYGFIKQSKGHIAIYSEVGRGTVVRMYLPRSHGQDAEQIAATTAMPGGSERILVVEDNADVRLNVVEQLRSLGYAVTEAGNGNSALAALESAADPYHLVLSDMVMPGLIDGKGLTDRIAQLWPGTRVLLMSGYTENALVREGGLDGVRLLAKPFRKGDLAHAVRETLDRPHHAMT
jgi:PAS domain S-box-containing protein